MIVHHKKVSGVLLPLSALPGPYGIGDLGEAAYQFIDWLARAHQHRWQVLPLTIPDSTGSPYASLSGEAGNWLLISAEALKKKKLLPDSYRPTRISGNRVQYGRVMKIKWQLVRGSYHFFTAQATQKQRLSFDRFRATQAAWLDEYILFQALKDRHHQQPWWKWESKWKKPQLARHHIDEHLWHQMNLHAYSQWVWSEQWADLRHYAHAHGVQLIGDLPFFVRTDSVDLWAHPGLFLLNRRGLPTVVAGVPPDYFARDGQLWGNPQYNWSQHRRSNFSWWIERLKILQARCDIIRLDHFRGLKHTWHVPHWAETAKRGWWVDSPGALLLRAVKHRIPKLTLMAEDLGSDKIGADALRRQFHIPTIRVMIFGWNGLDNNPHHPQVTDETSILYTSIHDTNTTAGWWRDEAQRYERIMVRQHLKKVTNISQQCIALAWSAAAGTTMTTVQDILGLGAKARFNRPGKQRGNWSWRLKTGQLTHQQADRLARLTKKYGRA